MNTAERTTDQRGRYVAAADPVARFMRYARETPSCWLWTGALIGKSGYGLFWHAGRKVVAHRWLWEQHHGALAPSQHVCHHCDVRHLLHMLDGTVKLILLTSRQECYRTSTVDWLHRYEIPYDYLLMRKDDDETDSAINKIAQLEEFFGSKVVD